MKKKLNDEDIQRLLSENQHSEAFEDATNQEDVKAYNLVFEVLSQEPPLQGQNQAALEEKIMTKLKAKRRFRWWTFENVVLLLAALSFVMLSLIFLRVLSSEYFQKVEGLQFLPLFAFAGAMVVIAQWLGKRWLKKVNDSSSNQ